MPRPGFDTFGGGGGAAGSTGASQQVIVRTEAGPSSYATGGWVIDLSTFLSSVGFAQLVTVLGSRGNLPAADLHVDLDTPTAGKVTVKVMRRRYDRVSAYGNVTGQPAGVTVAAASGQTTGSEAAHTHSSTHDHASFTSAGPTSGAGQVLLDVVGAQQETHTHTLDLPSLAGTSGAGTSHNHTDNSIYAHNHGSTHSATNMASTELAAGTNLSTTRWRLLVVGVSV